MADTSYKGDVRYTTRTSFSGSDLIVNFNERVIGELQQITYAVAREKAPVYVLGSPDPRSFSRGKRGVSGSLIFAVFDRDALYEELGKVSAYRDGWYGFTAAGNLVEADRTQKDFGQLLTLAGWDEAGNQAPTTARVLGGERITVPQGFAPIEYKNILYADQLPPFDICMTFANEYGQSAWQKIYDAEILNEGSGVSVDSIVMERQLTFVAKRLSPIMQGAYTGN